MDPTADRRIYVVRHNEPSRVLRRAMSLGDGRQHAMISPSPQIMSQRGHYISTPILINQQRLCSSQQQQFNSYQVDKRQRNNSTNSPSIMLMQTIVPSSSVFPVSSVQNNQVIGNTPQEVTLCVDSTSSQPLTVAVTSHQQILVNESVLCDNCGIPSNNPETCSSCYRKILPNAVRVKMNPRLRLAAESNDSSRRINGVSSSSFYNAAASQENDFNKFLRQTGNIIPTRKRPSNKSKSQKAAESVCITISSDSEEESCGSMQDGCGSMPASTPTSPTATQPNILSENSSEIPAKKCKIQIVANEEGSEQLPSTPLCRSVTPPNDEVLAKMTLNMKVESIRVGQSKLTPKSTLRIDQQNMNMTAFCPTLNIDIILAVPWQGVVNCDLCLDPREPCMYLVMDPSYVPRLRENLKMEKGRFPYYDPGGKDDERYFIFYIHSSIYSSPLCNFDSLVRKIDMTRRRLKKPLSFSRKITFEESECRQTEAAVAEGNEPLMTPHPSGGEKVQLTPTTPSASFITPATPVTTHHIVTRNLSKMSTISEDLRFMFSGPRVKLFVYPPPPSTGGITVTNEDQFCLNKGEFLNDVIIDFYLKYLSNRILSPQDRKRSYFFSCFFYERLTQKGPKKSKGMSPAERRHDQVKKWSRNVDLFSKDFIFIPINEASHWYLAVICFPGLIEKNYQSLKQNTQANKTQLPASMKYLQEYADGNEADDESLEGKSSKVESSQGKDVKGSQGEEVESSQYDEVKSSCGEGVESSHGEAVESSQCDEVKSSQCEGVKSSQGKGFKSSEGQGVESSQSSICKVTGIVERNFTNKSSKCLELEENTNLDLKKESSDHKQDSKAISDPPEPPSSPTRTPITDIYSNLGNDKMIEICITPGSPKFTLPKELKEKCTISPNKSVKVILHRTSFQHIRPSENKVTLRNFRTTTDLSETKSKKTNILNSNINRKINYQESRIISPEKRLKLTDNSGESVKNDQEFQDKIQDLTEHVSPDNKLHACKDDPSRHDSLVRSRTTNSSSSSEECQSPSPIIVLSSTDCSEFEESMNQKCLNNLPEKGLKLAELPENRLESNSSQEEKLSNEKYRSESDVSLNLIIETSTHDLSTSDLNPDSFVDDDAVEISNQMSVTTVVTISDDSLLTPDAEKVGGVFETTENCSQPSKVAADKSLQGTADKNPEAAADKSLQPAVDRSLEASLGDSGSSRLSYQTNDSTSSKPADSVGSKSSNVEEAEKQSGQLPQEPPKCGNGRAGEDSSPKKGCGSCQEMQKYVPVIKKPCILIFDSLRGPTRSKTASHLREYLTMEWITRKKSTHGERVFDKDTFRMSSTGVPQQDNYSDCGVFLLHYVEKFFSNPIRNFNVPIRDLVNWFDPSECSTKRDDLKTLINELHAESVSRCSK